MEIAIPAAEREIFATALQNLNDAGIPYVVAGAFCTHFYTGKWRYTKDMDLFAMPEVVPQALAALRAIGHRTWIEADHWLGKATKNSCLIDIIFGSGNWLAPIDEVWLARSRATVLFGQRVRMAPIEEMIWTKAYIAGRERFDGADICHLLSASKGRLDWQHLISRFGEHWQLLLGNLIYFSFVFPSDQDFIPDWVMNELLTRLKKERLQPRPAMNLCRGTLLDRFSYNFDVEQRGFVDAREEYALAREGSADVVVSERAWANERLARGEVYKRE